MEYIIITPAKNEEKYIENTLQSVLAQTIKPKKWIIVDDGSIDHTAQIVDTYSKECAFLTLIRHNSANEKRSGGSKVVRAFYVGHEHIRDKDYDVIVKMDADLTLPPNYFKEIIRHFEMNPKVGLCGGYCVIEEKGKYVKESYSEDHVRGAFKSYRRKCFEDIGGIKEIWAWDGLDEAAVRFHGWDVKVLPLPVVHHRPTSAEYNLLRHSFKTGREMYKERVDLFSLAVVSVVNLFRKPVIVGSILYVIGFVVSFLKREEKIIEIELGEFIRKERYNSVVKKLTFGLCGD